MRPGPFILTLLVALLAAGTMPTVRNASDTTVHDPGRVVFYATDANGSVAYSELDPGTGETGVITGPAVDVVRGALDREARSVFLPCHPASRETLEDNRANTGICRVDLATGAHHLVVDAERPVRHPTPSPDGDRIVFASGADGDHGLKVTSAQGGEIAGLCSGFCPLFRFFDIAWSPDESRVAFVATTPGSAGHFPQIYVVTVGKSDYTQLTNSGGIELSPAWSPDGSRLAFTSARTGDTEIWVMNADGTGQTQLTHRDGPDLEPTWSPDGTSIAYSRRVGGSWDLAVVPSSGGESTSLTSLAGDEHTPVWLAEPSAD